MSPLALCLWKLLRATRSQSSAISPKPISPKIRPASAVHSSSFQGAASGMCGLRVDTRPACARKGYETANRVAINGRDLDSIVASRQKSRCPTAPNLCHAGVVRPPFPVPIKVTPDSLPCTFAFPCNKPLDVAFVTFSERD